MEDRIKDLECALEYINPEDLSYSEWASVGMALKYEGASVDVWDRWSSQDGGRYHAGECEKKWNSFINTGITGNTIFKMASENGYISADYQPIIKGGARELFDGETVEFNYRVIDKSMMDYEKLPEVKNWNPVEDIRKYLSVIYAPNDHVAYCVKCFQDQDGKYHPGQRNYDRTAGRLMDELDHAKRIEDVFYDYDHNCGAWISFNPMDGGGCKIDNITDFKYALVESDTQNIDMQYSLMTKLELPIAALVHSGNKSIHAIVRIEASNEKEYSRRVDYLFKVCKQNGLDVDTSTKNPSRLSRMPGFERGNNRQYLITTNIGKESWNDWVEYIESINDDLPDPESLEDDWSNLPELAPCLINDVLRQGHKMLIAGPSKAGKSFALIELTIAIAEGCKWLNKWDCAQGKVLYINLELDRASCLHRFKDVYEKLGIQRPNLRNVEIWNLRGNAVPMDKLTPKLIRRAQKKNYIAVIIDPIYKVITGDENSAEQMAKFTNQFDKVASALNCAVIYCHHHSKGSQGSKKSMDRASGSGVFARDPDAMIDLIQIPLNDGVTEQQINKAVCDEWARVIKQYSPEYYETIPYDDFMSRKQMGSHLYDSVIIKRKLNDKQIEIITQQAELKASQMTAWRVDMTLREFPKPQQTDIWFNYPIHTVDTTGVLADIPLDEETSGWRKGKPLTQEEKNDRKREKQKNEKVERETQFNLAFEELSFEHDEVTMQMMADKLLLSKKTVQRRLNELKEKFKTIETPGKDSVIVKTLDSMDK